ncbi:MAG: hypothetical protein N2327_04725 [Caldimicrobium sp.]|nr:hypothetical protein [Caldimicrobium sp.]MDW8093640.1 hypothetical protein [Caldimicrobium sp.]
MLLWKEEKNVQSDVLQMNLSITAKGNKIVEVINVLAGVDRAIRGPKVEYFNEKFTINKNCF